MTFLEYLQGLTKKDGTPRFSGSTAHKYNDAVGTVNNRIAAITGTSTADIRTATLYADLITIYFQHHDKAEGNYMWSAAINHVKRYRAS
jgi:hypothetical protein